MAGKGNLQQSDAALVVIDMQEAFRHAIADFSLIASRISTAVRGFRILDVPIIVSEQYPKGLGHTAEEIALLLPDDIEIIEKTSFSCCGEKVFIERLNGLGVKQIAVCGIEAHVCVNQTVHDLLTLGFDVHLLTDCVGSRFEHDCRAGIAKMRGAGAVDSSVEIALFEMMRDARHPRFREIQEIIK